MKEGEESGHKMEPGVRRKVPTLATFLPAKGEPPLTGLSGSQGALGNPELTVSMRYNGCNAPKCS